MDKTNLLITPSIKTRDNESIASNACTITPITSEDTFGDDGIKLTDENESAKGINVLSDVRELPYFKPMIVTNVNTTTTSDAETFVIGI